MPLGLTIKDYTVIQLKTRERNRATHTLYLKEHTAAQHCVEWPQGRTLIVYNVPPYFTEENLQSLFQSCGVITKMYLQSKPSSRPLKNKIFQQEGLKKSVQVAYVVFKKATSVKTACSINYDNVHPLCDKNVTGLREYIAEYKNIPDVEAMEKAAEAFMADYYKKKEEDEKREKELAGVPDEEGFIKVTRHSKNKAGRRTEETEKKGREHIQKRNKKNELKDFYTFQFRETKRKHIMELQAKFEEDKKKVREMKQARKFKPY
ncbi:ribosomal RNA-processing protein 7 homolog A-like [Physella acuta]|uniref:ribosomal RNA-processing protein 7 homolog A-like n=1 Tax=Physella acuta TaxID=109671 RepID=UPI0027DBE9F1|nr:ribosomal RNA-processing protein 7 homolog A-like [Physella acuta]